VENLLMPLYSQSRVIPGFPAISCTREPARQKLAHKNRENLCGKTVGKSPIASIYGLYSASFNYRSAAFFSLQGPEPGVQQWKTRFLLTKPVEPSVDKLYRQLARPGMARATEACSFFERYQ